MKLEDTLKLRDCVVGPFADLHQVIETRDRFRSYGYIPYSIKVREDYVLSNFAVGISPRTKKVCLFRDLRLRNITPEDFLSQYPGPGKAQKTERITEFKDSVEKLDNKKTTLAKPKELPYQLLPQEWEVALVYLLAKGAKKYAPYDWELNPDTSTYMDRFDSARRHLKDWLIGVDYDDETGSHNLVAAAFNLLMVMTWQVRNQGVDNRSDLVAKDFIESMVRGLRNG